MSKGSVLNCPLWSLGSARTKLEVQEAFFFFFSYHTLAIADTHKVWALSRIPSLPERDKVHNNCKKRRSRRMKAPPSPSWKFCSLLKVFHSTRLKKSARKTYPVLYIHFIQTVAITSCFVKRIGERKVQNVIRMLRVAWCGESDGLSPSHSSGGPHHKLHDQTACTIHYTVEL